MTFALWLLVGLLLLHAALTMWAQHQAHAEMRQVFQYMRQICRNTTLDPVERYECDR